MHADRPLPKSRATRHAQFAGAVALAAAAATGAVAGSTLAPSATLPGAAAEPTTAPTGSSAAPTAPSTSTSTGTSSTRPSTTGSSGSTATSATGSSTAGGSFPVDGDGYVDSAARCDDQVPVAFGRTSRALVAVCVDRDGQLEYRGVRLSDKASVNMPASRASDGAIVASNDGVTYAVSPTMLLVSEGDTVIYRDAWIEFREPRFSEDTQKPATTSSSPTAGPTSTGSTSTAPTTTVTTTTVTVTPSSQADS